MISRVSILLKVLSDIPLIIWKCLVFHRSNKLRLNQVIPAIEFYACLRNAEFYELNHAEKEVLNILDRVKPITSPLNMHRIGPEKDSGYLVADINEVELLLSGGAGKNIDFEINYANQGCKVHICDPFVRKLPKAHPNVFHHKILLDDNPNKKIKFPVWNFSELVNNEFFHNSGNKMLKLDVEGSELNLLGTRYIDLGMFNQIVIEIHNLHLLAVNSSLLKFRMLFQNLLRFHNVIYFNGNNNGFLLNFGEVFIPEVFEITLLHKEYFIHNSGHSRSNSSLEPQINNSNRLLIPDVFKLNNK